MMNTSPKNRRFSERLQLDWSLESDAIAFSVFNGCTYRINLTNFIGEKLGNQYG